MSCKKREGEEGKREKHYTERQAGRKVDTGNRKSRVTVSGCREKLLAKAKAQKRAMFADN